MRIRKQYYLKYLRKVDLKKAQKRDLLACQIFGKMEYWFYYYIKFQAHHRKNVRNYVNRNSEELHKFAPWLYNY